MKTKQLENTLTAKIEVVFAEAVISSDKTTLESLLDDHNDYTIYGKQDEVIETNRAGFITWLLDHRQATGKMTYYLDTCIQCKFGAPVVMFNDGYFPARYLEESANLTKRERSGFMLDIEGGCIKGVGICHSFLKTENLHTLEKTSERVHAYMKINDCCLDVGMHDLGLSDMIGVPEELRYDSFKNYLLVAEFTDEPEGNKGYILRTYPDIHSVNKEAHKLGLYELATKEGKERLQDMFQHRPWYRINNSGPVPQAIYEVPTSIVLYRIIDLKADYTPFEFIKQRSKKTTR